MKQADLRSFAPDTSAPPRSTTLFQESALRTLLLHLKSGERIPEHQTRGAITVQCLQGQVSFSSGEETVELTAGLLIGLPPAAPHSVLARQDSLLIVTASTLS
jgi:quercetin dioxygenase-like cupin family protein